MNEGRKGVSGGVSIGISQTMYTLGEKVTFWMKNMGNELLKLRDTDPWKIEKKSISDWKEVYISGGLPVIVKIKTGEIHSWQWGQTTNQEDVEVGSGLYHVIIEVMERGKYVLSFKIMEGDK